MRFAAMEALNLFWPNREEVVDRCVLFLSKEQEPHEGIRAGAMLYLAHCFSGSKNREMAGKLAQVVRAQNESALVKRLAYLGIMNILHGFRTKDDLNKLRYPEDVDWTLVNSL